MHCDICQSEMTPSSWVGIVNCPKCGQRYEYDEGVRIILTDKQKELLRNAAISPKGKGK